MTDYKFTLIEAHGYWNAMSPPDLEVGDTIEIIAEKTGSDIVRELLKEGCVVCGVSNDSQEEADNNSKTTMAVRVIEKCRDELFYGIIGWKFASPSDTSRFAQYGSEVKE